MENKYNIILLTALLVLMAPVAALAILAPHDYSNNYRCGVCHNAHATLGSTGFNNICTNCHRPGDPKAGTKPFYQTDAANPYGSILNGYSGGVTPSKIYQTSHNWAGSDTNPKAGSQAPTNPAMATPVIVNKLLCVRCHAIHGNRSSATNSPPFLRVRNDNNQMCLDCHKVRDTNSHMTGSHPINLNYTSSTSKVKLNPADYNSTPVNINPANPTSAMNLVNGKILCTTCHGVHYTDSRSGTTHNAASFAKLSTSKGMILRTNARGATATDMNVCTNCHRAKLTHNAKSQNIQCNDCHSGHVEYDANAVTADEKIPNKFLVRRYFNISTQYGAVRNVRTFYRYTGATTKEFFLGGNLTPGTQPVGICQACHNNTTAFRNEHYTSATGTGLKTNHKDCESCHSHKSSNGSFSCGNCHGLPPGINAKGQGGYAVWSTTTYPTHRPYTSPAGRLDETKTPHTTHAGGSNGYYSIACWQCHNGNNHNSGNFRQVFYTKAGTIVGALATYSSAASRYSCSSMYCHSNALATPTYATVNWNNTKGTITTNNAARCKSCHSDKTNPAALSGAHNRHTGVAPQANYACQNCHAATIGIFDNNTSLFRPATKHVNGVKDVSYSFNSNNALNTKVSGTTYAGNQTCSTIYCHSNGAGKPGNVVPNWATPSTGQCGACHKVLATTLTGGTAFGVISSNAHFEHLSSVYGPKLQASGAPAACQYCHVSYNPASEPQHVDGAVVVGSYAGSYCYKCHGGWQQGGLPAWTGTTRLTCTLCHPTQAAYSASRLPNGLAAPKKTSFTTTGHGQALTNYSSSRNCASCHDKSSPHISSALGTYKRIAVNDNTLCSGCHNNSAKVPTVSKQNVPTHATDKGGPYTMDCKVCHDVHGTSNIKMVKSFVTFTNAAFNVLTSTITYASSTNDFVRLTPPFRGLCQTCHTKTTHYKRNVDEAGKHPTSGCLNCHAHKDTYAFKPKPCDACHGYPPAPKGFVATQSNYSTAWLENYSGGGGAHVKAGHILTNVRPSQGFTPCVACHNDGGSAHVARTAIFNPMTSPTTLQKKANTSVRVDGAYKFNPAAPLDATQYRKAAPANTGSCWNVSCHFQPTPRWSVDK